jgi:hypothetical protein
MTSTGRHLDETQAGIPNAPSERADLYGQSYCERHQGQLPKGRTQRPDIWAHRSRMRSAKEKRALDRGVVPHMGIPLSYTWLNPSTRPRYRHRPFLIFTFPCACSLEPAPRLTWTLEPQPSHGEGICEADAECPLIGAAAGLRDDR